MSERDIDVIVIGAGLGGLLSAAQFLQRGQRVAVIERLAHPGGRFTAKTFRGAQVSTGAVHMLPFGSNGELAAMLRQLRVPHRVHDAEVFASFHVRGRQHVCRSLLQLAGVLGVRQSADLLRVGGEMMLAPPRPAERSLSFRDWLDRRISRTRSPEVYAYFERICHFALSVDLADVPYREIVETTKNMLRYGPPGIVDGGCAAVTGELERRVLAAGGALLLQHDVLAITSEDGRVTGVRARDRATGAERHLTAPLVVSNIGPTATHRLIARDPASAIPDADATGTELDAASTAPDGAASAASAASADGAARREASGLKVHLLSDASIIPHQGIMYCLDTQRIAGIVQPSNSDQRLAPPGKHLLITHQLMRRGEDISAAREAARADLRFLFGADFGTRVTILTMSQYRGDWPVNRIAQGADVPLDTGLAGLYLVGDAVKPAGYLMVEGVAQSVNALLDVLDRLEPGATVAPAPHTHHPERSPHKPPRRRALHWLIAPPPAHPDSSRPIQIPLPGADPAASHTPTPEAARPIP